MKLFQKCYLSLFKGDHHRSWYLTDWNWKDWMFWTTALKSISASKTFDLSGLHSVLLLEVLFSDDQKWLDITYFPLKVSDKLLEFFNSTYFFFPKKFLINAMHKHSWVQIRFAFITCVTCTIVMIEFKTQDNEGC